MEYGRIIVEAAQETIPALYYVKLIVSGQLSVIEISKLP